MNTFTDDLKSDMETLTVAYEEFDLDLFAETIAHIQKLSKSNSVKILNDECAMFLSAINQYGFEGIYSYFQEFIDIVTDCINEFDN